MSSKRTRRKEVIRKIMSSSISISPIEPVEEFIRKLHSGDIIIVAEKARSIIVDKDIKMTLAEALPSAISNYELLGKGGAFPTSERENLANLSLKYINEAYANGVIQENKRKRRG
jgi:hypothetical protein